jgi:arylsulfatase A-like enzyme
MVNRPQNVVLLVIDSLRCDRLSAYGHHQRITPFLDSIAKDGVKFDTAYAPAPWTVPVHGSLFSGELPSYHGSHRKSKKFEWPAEKSLAGRMSGAGYQTAGFSANPWLTPEFNYDIGFDTYDYLSPQPPFPDEETSPKSDISDFSSIAGVREILSWAKNGDVTKRIANGSWKKFFESAFVEATTLNEAIIEWIRNGDADNQFVFANYMDVHDPHYGSVFADAETSVGSITESTIGSTRRKFPLIKDVVDFQSEPEDIDRARELYEKSLQELDRDLRDLFERLSKVVNLEDTLTIILGDHGECMGEHGYWGHGTYLYEELLRVPLIMWYPGADRLNKTNQQSPVSIRALYDFLLNVATGSSNIVDEITKLLNEEDPIFAECTGPRPNMSGIASQEGYTAVIDDGWKFVRNRETDEGEFIQTDNHSDRSMSQPNEERFKRLEQEKWGEVEFGSDEEELDIDEKTADHLSDLGYI